MSSSSSSSSPSSSSSSSFSSSSSPPNSSSSSSSSSSGACGHCDWEIDLFAGQYQIIKGCDGAHCECSPPDSLREVIGTVQTLCTPITSLPSTSSTSGNARGGRLTPSTARIRIPDIHNPLVWHTVLWPITGPWSVFRAPAYGWMITFLKVPSGPASPTISPRLTPTEGSIPATEATSAIVELQESSGVNQYCVTVQEEFGWAQLQTAEWTVVFIKQPSP